MSEISTNMTSVSRLGRFRTARTTLSHPVFWAALAILVLNDHVLKGAGLVPALLTGKLSDFAGLIVAPWLAVATFGALGARTRHARTVAFAVVVLPFALTNASPMCAAWLDAAMSALGLAWRTWSDPTDLVALAVLPLTWHLTTPRAARPSRSGAHALERASLVLGAAACLATSRAPEPTPATIQTTAWVLNRTGEPITLRVHWAEAEVDCDAIAGRGVRAATRAVFGGGTSFALPANGVIGLANTMRVPAAIDPFRCQVVLLQADGLDDTVVAWSSLEPTFMPNIRSTDDGDPLGRVTLVRRDTEIVPVAGTDVEVGDLALLAPPSSCPRVTGESVEWSSWLDDRSGDVHRIESIDVGPDGCFGFQLTSEFDAVTRSFFLCVPDFAVPFAAGTRVTIDETVVGTGPGRSLRMESADGEVAERASLTIYAGVEQFARPGLTASLELESCEGDRQECGALTLPARSIVSYDDGVSSTLEPGETRLFDVSLDVVGVRSRLLYARGEQVIFAPDACESTRAELGVRGDFVLTTYGSGGAP